MERLKKDMQDEQWLHNVIERLKFFCWVFTLYSYPAQNPQVAQYLSKGMQTYE